MPNFLLKSFLFSLEMFRLMRQMQKMGKMTSTTSLMMSEALVWLALIYLKAPNISDRWPARIERRMADHMSA